MQYLVLIYGEESADDRAPTPEELAPWMEYDRILKEAGVFVAGEALMPTQTATTIRGAGADAVLTDGPFAETREALGGFYLLECTDLDQAVHFGRQCPAVAYGSVEVRPVMDFSGM